MRISDFLCPKAIIIGLKARDKKGVITELVELLVKEKRVKDVNKVVQIIMEREKIGSTGIGQGVAIPHGKTDAVDKLVCAVGISHQGVAFDALDGEPVNLVFLLLSPPDSAGQHLRALACISRFLKDKFFRQALLESKTVEEVQKILHQEEEY